MLYSIKLVLEGEFGKKEPVELAQEMESDH